MERCLGCMNEYDAAYDVCPHCGYVKGTAEKSKNHLSPGSVLIDRYLIGRCLGQGGFGITYIAWDQRLYKKVAIKEFMPTSLASRITGQMDITCYNDEAQERFQNGIRRMLDESRRLARFNDLESVVKVYDCFEANQTAYIIMELLDGENIKTILAQQQTIDLAQTAKIMLPVLQALRVIHASGLIHRDISPDNIFVCNNGKVKLLDFGSARVASGSDDKSLSVILKPGYAPKEQYSSSAKQGAYTDVYAVCATIYKMLTGVTPIDSLERRVQDDELAPIDTLVAMPKQLARVMEQGLAVEAKDRLQTVDPLLEAFQSIAADDGKAASGKLAKAPKKAKAKKKNPKKRKKIGVGVGIAAACIAVVAAGAVGVKLWRDARDRQEPVVVAEAPADGPVYSDYAQNTLLPQARLQTTPTDELPKAQLREELLKKYEKSLTYSADAGKLYADFKDDENRLQLREHRTLPKNEAEDFTVYTYTKKGEPEAVVHYDPDGSVLSAQRYFYEKDGSLFAHSVYTGNALTQTQIFTQYDAEGRPLQATIERGSTTQSVKYLYDDDARVEKETRKDEAGDTVYERTTHLDSGKTIEIERKNGEAARTAETSRTADDRPLEYTETSYGLKKLHCKWEYDKKNRLKSHTLCGEDDRQQAKVKLSYEKGKLDTFIVEKAEGIREGALEMSKQIYVLYDYDEQGNMTHRAEFSLEDEPISSIESEYDDQKRVIHKTYLDKDGALTESYDYEYWGDDDQTDYTVTKKNADGKKESERKVWETPDHESGQSLTTFDSKGREIRYEEWIEDVLAIRNETQYDGDSRTESRAEYDGDELRSKTVVKYGQNGRRVYDEAYADDGSGGEQLTRRTEYDDSGEAIALYLYENGKLTDQYKVETRLIGKFIVHSDGNGTVITRTAPWSENWEDKIAN